MSWVNDGYCDAQFGCVVEACEFDGDDCNGSSYGSFIGSYGSSPCAAGSAYSDCDSYSGSELYASNDGLIGSGSVGRPGSYGSASGSMGSEYGEASSGSYGSAGGSMGSEVGEANSGRYGSAGGSTGSEYRETSSSGDGSAGGSAESDFSYAGSDGYGAGSRSTASEFGTANSGISESGGAASSSEVGFSDSGSYYSASGGAARQLRLRPKRRPAMWEKLTHPAAKSPRRKRKLSVSEAEATHSRFDTELRQQPGFIVRDQPRAVTPEVQTLHAVTRAQVLAAMDRIDELLATPPPVQDLRLRLALRRRISEHGGHGHDKLSTQKNSTTGTPPGVNRTHGNQTKATGSKVPPLRMNNTANATRTGGSSAQRVRVPKNKADELPPLHMWDYTGS